MAIIDPRFALCWGTVEHANLRELIEVAGANGFPALQVRPGLYLDAREAGARDADIQSWLADNNVRVEMIDTFGPRLPGIVRPKEISPRDRAGLEMPEEVGFDLAEALGAKTINLPHYMGDPKTPLAAIREAFAGFCERAGKRGFNVAFEFIPGTAVPDLLTCLDVVRGIPNGGVLLDTWHWSRSGGTLEHILALEPGDITAVQICDRTIANMTSTEPYVPMTGRAQPGYGDLPLAPILRHIFKTHPGMSVGVEIFSVEQRAYSFNEAARVSAVAMKRLFDML